MDLKMVLRRSPVSHPGTLSLDVGFTNSYGTYGKFCQPPANKLGRWRVVHSVVFFPVCLMSCSPSRDDLANPPVTELAANFSPMPRMATPPFGGLIAGGTGAEL